MLTLTVVGWKRADPICSLFIAILILLSVWPLLKSSAFTLLQRIPIGMEHKLAEISRRILGIEGVLGYSQPHVWELKTDHLVGTIKIQVAPTANEQVVRVRAQQVFRDVYGCKEVVVQVEKDHVNA